MCRTNIPILSIVVPVKNGKDYLIRALKSLLQQTFKDFEIILVDDHSTDGSAAAAASLRDPRLRILSLNERSGLVAALNHGILNAKGQFIARMDADDICCADRFERQMQLFVETPDLGLVYANAISFRDNPGEKGSRLIRSAPPEQLLNVLTLSAKGMTIIHPTVIARREALLSVGGYRDISYAEDRDLWLRMIGSVRFGHLDQPVLHYRLSPTGVSRIKRHAQMCSRITAVILYEKEEKYEHSIMGRDETLVEDLWKVLKISTTRDALALESLDRLRQAMSERKTMSIAQAALLLLIRHPFVLSPNFRIRRERFLVEQYGELVGNYFTMHSEIVRK
jgi:glycosyltransferase involved in cell wall biosynthesis